MQEPWIAFDGLGIQLEEVSKSFKLFGLDIYWYGVLIACGFLLAVLLGLFACRKYGFSQDDLLTYIIVCTPVAIICARIYFVAFKWNDYSQDLLTVFDIREGGLAIYGGVIGIAIAAFIATRVKKQSLVKLFDFALPYVLIGQAIGRWGNFINQEAYGVETDLPWGMSGSGIHSGVGDVSDIISSVGVPAVKVHPNFLYEFIWCLLVFTLIMIYRNKFRKNKGEVMSLYFIGYGIGRAVIESIRGEDTLMFMGQRVSMWLSILFVVGFGAYFIYLRFIKKTDDREEFARDKQLALEEKQNKRNKKEDEASDEKDIEESVDLDNDEDVETSEIIASENSDEERENTEADSERADAEEAEYSEADSAEADDVETGAAEAEDVSAENAEAEEGAAHKEEGNAESGGAESEAEGT